MMITFLKYFKRHYNVVELLQLHYNKAAPKQSHDNNNQITFYGWSGMHVIKSNVYFFQ